MFTQGHSFTSAISWRPYRHRPLYPRPPSATYTRYTNAIYTRAARQVPGELYGGRAGRRDARLSPLRRQGDRPAEEGRPAHEDHVPVSDRQGGGGTSGGW